MVGGSACRYAALQIAFVVFEVRDDLVLPLGRHGNIVVICRSSDRRFGACGHQRRREEKNTEQSWLQHSQPKLNDDVHTTAQLAADDVHARYSLAGETRGLILARCRIASVLDGRSRTDALAGWCVQLRRHPPRGPRCQPRPQPPATATTWLVSSTALAMAAPLAGLASAFDALSAPTPTATMAAASNARIWLLLFLADTLGRPTD